MAELACTITTPERLVFAGPVRFVVVPATDGELGFLPRHAPLVGALGSGELWLEHASGERSRYFVNGGFVEVLAGAVTVLTPEAVAAADMDASQEEARVRELEASRPPAGSSLEEREEHSRALGVARRRLRLARKGR